MLSRSLIQSLADYEHELGVRNLGLTVLGNKEEYMADAFNAPGVVKPFGIFSSAAWQPEGQVLHISGHVSQAPDPATHRKRMRSMTCPSRLS